jgi:hypothetical protein
MGYLDFEFQAESTQAGRAHIATPNWPIILASRALLHKVSFAPAQGRGDRTASRAGACSGDLSGICPQNLWISLWTACRAALADRENLHKRYFGQKIDKSFYVYISWT